MSFDSAPITVRIPLSIELTRGVSQIITAPLYRDGAAVVATAVDATVYDSAGQEVTIGTSAAIVSDVASWTLTPASTVSLGTGYRIEWDITSATGVTRAVVAAAVVRRAALHPVITDGDLFRRDPMLNAAEAGYILAESVNDLQDYIDEAWTEILGRVWAKGRRPALVMEPAALRSAHIYLSLALAYGTVKTADAREDAAESRTLFETAWGSLSWQYDSDDDGAPDEGGERQTAQPVTWTA